MKRGFPPHSHQQEAVPARLPAFVPGLLPRRFPTRSLGLETAPSQRAGISPLPREEHRVSATANVAGTWPRLLSIPARCAAAWPPQSPRQVPPSQARPGSRPAARGSDSRRAGRLRQPGAQGRRPPRRRPQSPRPAEPGPAPVTPSGPRSRGPGPQGPPVAPPWRGGARPKQPPPGLDSRRAHLASRR